MLVFISASYESVCGIIHFALIVGCKHIQNKTRPYANANFLFVSDMPIEA